MHSTFYHLGYLHDAVHGGPGELYEQLEVDLTSMELCVANPADEACARLQLEDLLYWLQVSSGNFLRFCSA